MKQAVEGLKKNRSAERQENDAQRRARIEHDGGVASEKLAAWRRRIPITDRIQLAKNMDALIRQHNIQPADLKWQPDYQSAVEFRNALFRSRISSDSSPAKRLTATAATWMRLVDYIRHYLNAQDILVSREHLVERITRGTRFHPSQQFFDERDQIVHLMEGLADKLASELNLLPHYLESSRLRAEYFKENGTLLEAVPYFGGNKARIFECSLGELFGGESLWNQLPDKLLCDLTKTEWDRIISALPHKGVFASIGDGLEEIHAGKINDGSSMYAYCTPVDLAAHVVTYFDLRSDRELKGALNKKLTELTGAEWKQLEITKDIAFVQFGLLHLYVETWNALRDTRMSIGAYVHSREFSVQSLDQFPHILIGYFDYNLPGADENRVLDPGDDCWSRLIASGLSADFDFRNVSANDNANEHVDSLCFLTLIPDLEASRLIPCVFTSYDSPAFIPLSRLQVAEGDEPFSLLGLFPPGGPAVVRDALEIIFDDIDRIINGLTETAKTVRHHNPYIKRKEQRRQKMDRLMATLWEH